MRAVEGGEVGDVGEWCGERRAVALVPSPPGPARTMRALLPRQSSDAPCGVCDGEAVHPTGDDQPVPVSGLVVARRLIGQPGANGAEPPVIQCHVRRTLATSTRTGTLAGRSIRSCMTELSRIVRSPS